MLRQAVRLNSLSELAITKLDILDTLESVKICVAYDVDGVRTESLPYHQSDVHAATPVYETFEGWGADLTGVRERADLPPAADAYLSTIEKRLDVPVRLVGVGPERDQYLFFSP
jgi:adenylosuccinate synthase